MLTSVLLPVLYINHQPSGRPQRETLIRHAQNIWDVRRKKNQAPDVLGLLRASGVPCGEPLIVLHQIGSVSEMVKFLCKEFFFSPPKFVCVCLTTKVLWCTFSFSL